MFGEKLYLHWAPPYSVWTPWVKPALFTQISSPPTSIATDLDWRTINTDWAPPVSQRTALIIDLPDTLPLAIGLSLAQRGYCPVMLFNCCRGARPVIDLEQCVRILCAGEDALRDPVFPPDAPPAFLLDSRRKRGDRIAMPGLFDNRWIVLPQDFPSATFLVRNNIRQAAYVQQFPGPPMDDLAHVLMRWQEAGVGILGAELGKPLTETRIKRPSKFGYMWYALLAIIGLHPNSAGGFGSVIPSPSQGSGWG